MPSELLFIALVAVGGFFGGLARYLVSGFVARRIGEFFPWGTLAVNASGALSIGILGGVLSRPEEIPSGDFIWIVLAVGVLGSYTTVSSFSLQTLSLARDGAWHDAVLNIVASVAICFGAVLAGFLLANRLIG